MLVVKNPPANVGDTRNTGLIPGLGRSLGVGNGNPLQYSCLENSMDRGAWQSTVHRVAKSWAQESTKNSQHSVYTVINKNFSENKIRVATIKILIFSFSLLSLKNPCMY